MSFPGGSEDRAAAERAEAESVIRRVHAYCEGHCPYRERCPGMRCKLYREEQVAKDTLLRLDAEEAAWDPPIGPGGVILEPTI